MKVRASNVVSMGMSIIVMISRDYSSLREGRVIPARLACRTCDVSDEMIVSVNNGMHTKRWQKSLWPI